MDTTFNADGKLCEADSLLDLGYPCWRTATTERADAMVCAQHARMYDLNKLAESSRKGRRR